MKCEKIDGKVHVILEDEDDAIVMAYLFGYDSEIRETIVDNICERLDCNNDEKKAISNFFLEKYIEIPIFFDVKKHISLNGSSLSEHLRNKLVLRKI